MEGKDPAGIQQTWQSIDSPSDLLSSLIHILPAIIFVLLSSRLPHTHVLNELP